MGAMGFGRLGTACLSLVPRPPASMMASMPLAGGHVQDLVKTLDLRLEIRRVVANKKAPVVSDVCVDYLSDAIVVKVLDDIVAQEVSTCNDAVSDIGLLERGHDFPAVDVGFRVQDYRKGEPGTLPI